MALLVFHGYLPRWWNGESLLDLADTGKEIFGPDQKYTYCRLPEHIKEAISFYIIIINQFNQLLLTNK